MRLTAASLAELADRVAVPRYDRSAVRAGIVHFGVGGFHRAHQAMYLDRLMNAGIGSDWGVCGVGVLPADRRMKEVLHAQDGLYTLVVRPADGPPSARVIGSIVDYLLAPEDPVAVIDRMADPATKIVSLTVTEGGYHLHPVTGRFQSDPRIERDLEPAALPQTMPGLIAEALNRRRLAGAPAFTVMSCDNVESNGDTVRRSLCGFAARKNPALEQWIRDTVRFPNSMVDRITPATTEGNRQWLVSSFGVEDGWPVQCEPFSQWVLEDSFADGRPPLEQAGVQLVPDVRPYELMKLRLLNAGHQAICYFGYLAGYRLVHEVARDPHFARFLRRYLAEAVPTLPPVPGVDLDRYQSELIERFSNANISDTLARLCTDSSDRIPGFVLPVIRQNLAAGGEIARSVAVIASWARYAEGIDEQGKPIVLNDPRRDRLTANARRQRAEPLAFLADRQLFGDLVDNDRFTTEYLKTLQALHTRGARATVELLAA